MLKKANVVMKMLRTMLPIYNSDVAKKKMIIVTNYVLDKRFFVEIINIYGSYLLRFNYGINRYLSELYICTGGMQKRTAYYFFTNLFNLKYITSLFSSINKIAYDKSYNNLQKKICTTYFLIT